ncbi:hypothetical protein ACIRBX_34250 [Kitasatospora sp. NPDC096147]|uniref:hypothetical protein n=1 Tax=Kitasatospora sp. NPDC096147 TaxID=3364093 RepID=UPI0038294960
MTDTKDALYQALRDNDEEPHGRPRTVKAEELAEAAEQFDDRELLLLALFDLMEAYEYDAEPRKAPVVFARILKLWDQHPDEFNEWSRLQLFWRFKWVASSLLSVPEVPLAAIERWHAEMRERYRTEGLGLQPYYAQRYHLAAHTGTGTEDAYELWAGRPRTRYSDCHACELRAQARHHVGRGDDQRALETWAPVLDGTDTCTEEPYTSQAHALLPLLRLGRTDQARSAHLAGYRAARGKSNAAGQIGLHLEFCALSGNAARGLEILAENRDLFAAGQGDPISHLSFLTGVELLLATLADQDHGDLTVSGPPGGPSTVAGLLALVRGEAEDLAARFDARNGTDRIGTRRLERLARRPLLTEPLALGLRAATVVPTAPAAPARPTEPAPEDFTELVLRARELRLTAHPEADRLWQLVADRRAAEDGPLPEALGPVERLLADLALQRASDAFDRDEDQLAAAELVEAERLFELAGYPDKAAAQRARGALVNFTEDDWTADWALLDESLRITGEALAAGRATGPEDLLVVRQCRAMAGYRGHVGGLPEPTAEATEVFEREVTAYHAEALAHGYPHRAATALMYRADALGRAGQLEASEAAGQEALALQEKAGTPWQSPRTLSLLSQLRFQAGAPDQAVPLLHRALAEANRWGDTSFPFGSTYAMLGHAYAHGGDHAGAVRALSEAAARLDAAGDAASATEIRGQLADQLRESGRPADAVAVLESALLETDGLDERLTAQLRLDLARGLYALDENREAAEEYLRLADVVAGWEDQDIHTMVACEATVALAEAGHWEAAEAARDRAVASHAVAPRTGQLADVFQQFARLTMSAKGPDGLPEALGLLAEADRIREAARAAGEELDFWYLEGGAHDSRARVYAMAEQFEEGLAEAELSIAAYGVGAERGEGPRAEGVRLAAVLEGGKLGRTEAAAARLEAGIDRATRAGLLEAAAILRDLRERMQQD